MSVAHTRCACVQKQHVLRCTTLPSGALWCLVSPASLLAIKYVFAAEMEALHSELVAVYKSAPDYSGLQNVPDDGYFVLNALYHLLGAGRPQEIRCAARAVTCACPTTRTWEATTYRAALHDHSCLWGVSGLFGHRHECRE